MLLKPSTIATPHCRNKPHWFHTKKSADYISQPGPPKRKVYCDKQPCPERVFVSSRDPTDEDSQVCNEENKPHAGNKSHPAYQCTIKDKHAYDPEEEEDVHRGREIAYFPCAHSSCPFRINTIPSITTGGLHPCSDENRKHLKAINEDAFCINALHTFDPLLARDVCWDNDLERKTCQVQPCPHRLDKPSTQKETDLPPTPLNAQNIKDHYHELFECGPDYPHLYSIKEKKDVRVAFPLLHLCPTQPCPGRINPYQGTGFSNNYKSPEDDDQKIEPNPFTQEEPKPEEPKPEESEPEKPKPKMSETTINKTLTEGSNSNNGHRPPMFNGDRSAYKAFISKMKIYLQLNDEKYNTEPKQILVFISYLKDEPLIWAQNWIEEREKDSTGKPKLGALKDFFEALNQTYKPLNFARNALDQLYRLYQGTSRAEEFVNRFKLYA
jgi:hypothetical protein